MVAWLQPPMLSVNLNQVHESRVCDLRLVASGHVVNNVERLIRQLCTRDGPRQGPRRKYYFRV